ncbi:endonuclease MutS2 [Sinanaerobacter chloroacetimidivorans]|uniref:Endonuclease MutS2 n=1 Tax=Sinanaerobacter chloroacetimidivorans TaxID=2818044 RepID=A0A8J8AZZ5_9FIRM|nr:endonuclease MutS2 [Sinanaerobacter chloroacetimidivorans]MBR0597053.1 endonuclease MutS2 [Sinanaerobacter chloroacetimidivorans]
MNQKSYRVLEYYKILDLLSTEAASSITRKAIGELRPGLELYQIQEMLAETTEAVSVIMRKGALPLGSFYDIRDSIYLAEKGSTLTMKQLLEVLYNLQVVRNAASFLKSDLPELPIVKGLAEVLSIQKRLEENIDRCILSEDEMSDQASPELRNIRRTIQRQNEAIRAKMNQILNSSDNRTMLQDAIVTMRQGRYVIPVKQEHKSKFSGIVHDQSATGATLFIEPQAIVNLNNELREMELSEKVEIERILAELSAEVASVHQELLNNQDILLKLDFIFAKGRLSVKMKAEAPMMNTRGFLRIRDGRHPLIPRDKVVPISIALGKDYDTLVITGPNTGGKTVTLKTVGLFVMMAQSGLHLPAGSGTEMPVFNQVYADIGDEQSIEQSLSTFSSHMKNIVDILDHSDSRTLVLLDELGAGTDPTEGAALAISILEYLSRRGTKTIATTHYTELKKYAISTHRVENASMEFDVETLSPTYRLTIGTPGRSNAFEISKKLGLSASIIENAKGLLQRGDIEFEDVISSIEKDKKAAEEERDEAILLRLEMQKQKEQFEKEKNRLAEQKDKILSKAKEEARDMIREAKEVADQVQKELRELEKNQNASDRNRKYEEVRKKIRTASDQYRDKIQVETNPNPVKPEELKLGDRVKVLSLDQKGNIISLPDDRNEVQVQVGLLKINVSLDNLAKIQDGSGKKDQKKSRYGSLYRSKVQSISPSINVRGKQLDDALMDVDKYLDDAYIAGLAEVTVIHGRGEGILRDGLQQMFKTHKHVAQFRKGAYNEGGDGVTVIKLR